MWVTLKFLYFKDFAYNMIEICRYLFIYLFMGHLFLRTNDACFDYRENIKRHHTFSTFQSDVVVRHKVNPSLDSMKRSYLKDEIFKKYSQYFGNKLKSQNLISVCVWGGCQEKKEGN